MHRTGKTRWLRTDWRPVPVLRTAALAISIAGMGAASGSPPLIASAVTPFRPSSAGAGAAARPGMLWRFSTGPHPILTAPAVGRDGTLYAGAGDGVLYAVAPDGHRRWSLATGITSGQVPPVKPAIGPDGTSYWNLQGSVVAVAPNGRVRWVFLATGSGSPVLSRGRVLFAAGSYLYAINTTGSHAGQRAWRAAIGTSTPVRQPSPAVGPDGTAYVASPNGYLYAIAPNGLRRWAFHAGVPLTFSPAVGFDGTVYLDAFANGHGTLYALTLSGRPRWRVAVPAGSDVVRGPDGTIYVAAHLLVAISSRGHVLWQRVVDATAPPVALSPALVVAPTLSPPALLAFDAHGHAVWRTSLSAAAVGAPMAGAHGVLYSGDYDGLLVALAPSARGSGRLIRGAAPAAPAVDLGAGNPPFIVRGGAALWRVTLARTVERSLDGGRHWQVVLTPGQSLPDQRSGRYRNARYADVSFLAVDPHAPRGLYVGTLGALGDYLSGGQGGADGGLYYSPDGATGWRHLINGLSFTYEPRLRAPAYGLDSLVFDPVRRGVLYAQTPPAYGAPGHDAGLFKSTDGGGHWRLSVRGLPAAHEGNTLLGSYLAYPPGALLVDRARPSVLFLVAPTGFFRSADAASSWSRVPGVAYNDPASVAVRIGAGGTVRAYTDRGSYLSADFGAHWRKVASS